MEAGGVAMTSEIKLISASAGSGKTYRLMELVHDEVNNGLKANGLLAVTYTKKAAEELKQRIREKLVESGKIDSARSMASARIGTVHSICGEILKRFSFEDGSSPRQKVIDENESARLFENALNEALTDAALKELSEVAWKFGTNTEELISDVRKLALIIRQNNLADAALNESLKLSLAKIQLVTQSPRTTSNQANLVTEMERFLQSYPTPQDTTKTTAAAHKLVEDILAEIKNRNAPLSWYLWVKLSKVKAGAKSDAFFDGVREAARSFVSNGELRSDIEKMINLAFKLAIVASKTFKNKKKNLGVLDYGDLEEKTLALLDKEPVQADLKSELEILFVDEFQDTNPIQLAIFLRLSSLCKKTVWVGDLKQSIYRFRGADPELMKAVLQELGKGKVEVLDANWRSVPEVINFVNELYSASFLVDGVPADQVTQKPKWKHTVQTNGLEVWDGSGKNQGERNQKLANGILALLNEKIKITDRENEEQRELRAGDVSILCRSNVECVQLSEELKGLGIASSVVGGNLLSLPEITLALAAFRYLVNSRDTVAAAEIALALGTDQNEWLQNAINGNKTDTWNPALARISQARESISEMSIREKLDFALSVIPIDSVIEKMENGDSRTFHISALRQEVKKYEDVCQAAFLPCTDMGFLEYLSKSEPPIPSASHTEAVSILTYHASKGLEWPVVIMASLDKEVREPNLFEVRQEMIAGSKFKLIEPLANRIVTYLPWPFGDNKKVDEVDALIDELPEIGALRYAEESETRRLLYVGMTRAREKLVLFNTIKKTIEESMLAVLQKDGQALLAFDADNSKIVVDKKKFDCTYKATSSVATGTYVGNEKHSIVLPQGTPLVGDVKPLYLQPSHILEKDFSLFVGEISIGRSFKWGNQKVLKRVKDDARADIIGSAVHLFLGSDNGKLDHVDTILKNWNLTETLDANELVEASDRLHNTIKELWPSGNVYYEVPMEMSLDGSFIRGAIDCIVVTENEIVVIDHKTLTATDDKMLEIGNKYKYQLASYATAVQRHFKGKKVSTWIHNPDGWMCEVILGGK
jgi:ATP-dependent exoDNAse (exonuclease V) beta subunit